MSAGLIGDAINFKRTNPLVKASVDFGRQATLFFLGGETKA